MTLHELLAEVEGAKGPSRELDEKLCEAFGWVRQYRYDGMLGFDVHTGWLLPDGTTRGYATPLTASLDACAALQKRLLPRWGFFFRQDRDGNFCGALEPPYFSTTPGACSAATPALAWLAAIIRALIAQQETKEQSND